VNLNFAIFFFQEVNGITRADVQKLMDAGYHTINGFARALKKNFILIKGI
jgi:hypothetical protein